MVERTRPEPRRWIFIPAFLLLSVISVLWALASPIFSSPDENAHATKAIGQYRGELIGYEREGVRHPVIDLPPSYAYDPGIVCFVRQPDVPADCGVELGDAGTDWFSSWVSSYNPVYYYLVGWPSTFLDGSAGVYGMRIASALLGSAVLALAFSAAMASSRARWMPIGLAFLASPMVVYLIAAINPQGLEIAAGAALWVGLARLLESFREPESVLVPRWHLWSIVVVAATFLVVARALGPLWLLLITVAVVMIAGWQPVRQLLSTRASYPWVAVIAAAGIFSVAWTLWGGSLSGQAEPGDAQLVGGSFLEAAWTMIRNTPSYLQQSIGVFGWLDTPLPAMVYSVYVGALTVICSLALTSTGRSGLIRVVGTAALALAVPPLVQGYSAAQTGIIWQGRYGMIFYLGILLVAAWMLSDRGDARVRFLAVRMTVIAASLLAVFEVTAFLFVLRRYVIGVDEPVTDMLRDPQWQPPLGWVTLAVLLIAATTAFAVWVVRIAAAAAAREDRIEVGA